MTNLEISVLENTLEDGAWKDSFDKLLDTKPKLRELNVLKKTVKASFNIDSSVENSSDDRQFLKLVEKVKKCSASTPARKIPQHPFKCAISPIVIFKYDNLWPKKGRKKNAPPSRASKKLQSTVIDLKSAEIDYDSIKEKSSSNNSKKDDTINAFLKDPKKFGQLRPLNRQKVAIENRNGRTSNKRRTERRRTQRTLSVACNDVNDNGVKIITNSENLNEVDEILPINQIIENESSKLVCDSNVETRVPKLIHTDGCSKNQEKKDEAVLGPSKRRAQGNLRTLKSIEEEGNELAKVLTNSKSKSLNGYVLRHSSGIKKTAIPSKQSVGARKSSGVRPRKNVQFSDEHRITLSENGNKDRIHNDIVELSDEPQNDTIKSKQNQHGEHIINEHRASKSVEDKKIKKPSMQRQSSKDSTTNITLQPGKWRKSLSILRRSQLDLDHLRRSSKNVPKNLCQLETIADKDESVEFVSVTKFVGNRKTMLIGDDEIVSPQQSFVNIIDYKKRVLQCCNQFAPLPFNIVYSVEAMHDCFKIGEGVYGEVFMKKEKDELVVCKIIPIEGSQIINDEVQKTFEQILPEIVITKELSNLRRSGSGQENLTSGFVDIKRIMCVEGKYPDHLIKCWEKYDDDKGSENDHPVDFVENQLYIVLELEFAGTDLETFIFDNAEQSFAALKQIVMTIAVAEEELEFEHRDLHWGNVLISQIDAPELQYKISGQISTIPSKGIKATIIDYTLSRIKCNNHCFYNDLAKDEELFTAKGDYQFDIYRMMRDVLGTRWERFEPKTNIFWVSYIISKMINGVKYKNVKSKVHSLHLREMRSLKREVLGFNSAGAFAKYLLQKS